MTVTALPPTETVLTPPPMVVVTARHGALVIRVDLTTLVIVPPGLLTVWVRTTVCTAPGLVTVLSLPPTVLT